MFIFSLKKHYTRKIGSMPGSQNNQTRYTITIKITISQIVFFYIRITFIANSFSLFKRVNFTENLNLHFLRHWFFFQNWTFIAYGYIIAAIHFWLINCSFSSSWILLAHYSWTIRKTQLTQEWNTSNWSFWLFPIYL